MEASTAGAGEDVTRIAEIKPALPPD